MDMPSEHDLADTPTNRDDAYQQLEQMLLQSFEPEQVLSGETETLAFGTDASFYRLIPKLVVKLRSLAQLKWVMACCRDLSLPFTFRAAGTSLSGQAISDSVLLLLSDDWTGHQILEEGQAIRLQPGVIGADANRYLAPYQKKIGPDPASIAACKIGGIVANNASGMCCGTAQNSYNTLKSMHVVLADGSELDTADPLSVQRFRFSHGGLLQSLKQLAEQTVANKELRTLIQHKYRLKNTTGYSLNALIDYQDPIDILSHLMVGSEGTLGFIASVTYQTVDEHPHKASCLLVFDNNQQACEAVKTLAAKPVSAVELMDGRALASVADQPGMPDFIQHLDKQACALLVEARSSSASGLTQRCNALIKSLEAHPRRNEVAFTPLEQEYSRLWAIRKGLFPAVGAVRATGTTVVIEDVAFPIEHLAEGVEALQQLFVEHGYQEALIFGHALAGNLHFVFTQSFDTPEEVARYDGFMQAVSQLVAVDYKGSLKAEHGTGRNMAPFVELEWGEQGMALMQQIKQLFDPQGLLNPGVILNPDSQAHIRNLKPMPAADSLVDKCIECGFCEAVCPSRKLSLTPRQRIVIYREIAALRRSQDQPERLARMEKDFKYQGIDTCAAVGLCADRCPVGINTGDLVRKLRAEAQQGGRGETIARWSAKHFAGLASGGRVGLQLMDFTQQLLGEKVMGKLTHGAGKLIKQPALQQWSPAFPKAAASFKPKRVFHPDKVVYFPSCASRTMGPPADALDQRSLQEATCSVLEKAGFEVIVPEGIGGSCCGLPYHSKGFAAQSEAKSKQLEALLWQASELGRWPVLMDTSPCAKRSQEQFTQDMAIYEPVGFIYQHALPRLEILPLQQPIMLHLTCSSRRMGVEQAFMGLAKACAPEAVLPEQIYCCGWAGDKGFSHPELNASALERLREQVPEGCSRGYSNSRTCEIGLMKHSGIPYQSIVYLVDEVSL